MQRSLIALGWKHNQQFNRENFQEYIALMMKSKHREAKNQNVTIQAKPQFVSIFRKLVTVSTTKRNRILL